jgi:RNA polymerase sigma-70 factor (ECF subfamily)
MTLVFQTLLRAAQGGDRAALGKLLDFYRPALVEVAGYSLPGNLRGKLSKSDIVQQTFLEAQQQLSSFHGDTPAMFGGWLRTAMVNNVRDQMRHYHATARSVGHEISLDTDSRRVWQLTSDSSGPFEKAVHHEEHGQLEVAVESLAPEYRQAIILRHRENLTFADIGKRLNISENAARKLWLRALGQLRKCLSGV